MALKSHSVFYYGHVIDSTNNIINFREGAGIEKTATLPVGAYTLTKFVAVITAALNGASLLTWSGSVSRTTGIITITSSSSASLLLGSGSAAVFAPYELMGFNAADIVNTTLFVGSYRSGFSYSPQFPLQDYKGKNQNKKLVNAVVSKSATGDKISVQKFGEERFIKCNIKNITNRPTTGTLRGDPKAVENVTAFLEYCIEKRPIEFMEDENILSVFDKVYLQSTPQSSDGTQYELTEYIDRNLPEYFESGLLTFKIIGVE